MRTIDSDSLMAFHASPSDQGQTVEHSYAWVAGECQMVHRTYDRGDRSERCELLTIDPSRVDEIDVPNGAMPVGVRATEPVRIVSGNGRA